jgi:hypothetical protein
MKPLKRLLTIVLGLILMPGLLFAQKNLADWGNVEKLKSGTKVIVTTKKGMEFAGEKRQTTDDTLFMDVALPGQGTRTISLPREEVAEVRKRKSRGMMPLIGAAIGVAAGVAIGSTADHSGSDDPGLGKVVGGGLGGLIGLSAGGFIPRKSKQVYVAP